MTTVPIKKSSGLELVTTDLESVCRVKVSNPSGIHDLSWDRYVRLKACANAVKELSPQARRILDVGGFDGALAFFLPDYEIDLIDPATTGASILQTSLAKNSYEIVTAIDVLEHIEPSNRLVLLNELARIANTSVVLNYPCAQSKKAQELILKLTGNALIKEHVQWDLPDSNWVLQSMKDLGFNGQVIAHSSVAVWVGQYVTQNLAPDAAVDLNRYLIEDHDTEPFATPLYHLVICKKFA